MAKRDKHQWFTQQVEERVKEILGHRQASTPEQKALYDAQMKGLNTGLELIDKLFDRRKKTLECPEGHRFTVGLYASVKEGVRCPHCGKSTTKVLKKEKPSKKKGEPKPDKPEVKEAVPEAKEATPEASEAVETPKRHRKGSRGPRKMRKGRRGTTK